MKKLSCILLVFVAFNCSFAESSSVLPHAFKAGDTARAAAVNENFAFLLDLAKKNAASIDSLKAALTVANSGFRDSIKAMYTKIKADSSTLTATDSARQLPKGTIAAFLTSPGGDGFLPGSGSTWLLAAGQGEVNGVVVPDMRGRFLRGIDYTVTGHPATHLDPDGERTAGNLQADTLKAHSHSIKQYVAQGGAIQGEWNVVDNTDRMANIAYIGFTGGAETRPCNIAVFWYIKVR